MAVLTDSDIDDLVLAAKEELNEGSFVLVGQDLQKYIVMKRWLAEDKLLIDGGRGFKQTLLTHIPDVFRQVGMYEKDVINVENILDQLSVHWTHGDAHWTYDYKEIMEATQAGDYRVVDLVQARRCASFVSVAAGLETKAWAVPSSTETKEPWGLPYYIVHSTTAKTTNDGFNGMNPTGHSSVAGIDTGSGGEANYRNWTSTYADVSEDDLVEEICEGVYKTDWVSPVNVEQLRSFGNSYRLYTCYSVYKDLRALMRGRNDNMGSDLAEMDGRIVVHGHPIEPNRQLDAKVAAAADPLYALNPVYGVNHDTFFPIVQESNYLRENEPIRDPDRHDVRVMWVNLSYNFVCIDRKRNFVIIHN